MGSAVESLGQERERGSIKMLELRGKSEL